MAYLGRGNIPSIGNDVNNGGNSDGNSNYLGHMHRHIRYYCYVPLDNTYVIFQMIVTFFILIVGVITYLATYKSTILDPLEGTKKLFINSELIITVIFLITMFVVNIFSKKEEDLSRRLVLILMLSLILFLVFLGIKLNLDVTYNEAKFEQIYTEQNGSESEKKTRIDIGIAGASLKTEKQYYIDESIKLYNIFKIKSYGSLGLHLLFNVLLIYQILKMQKIQNGKEQLARDDSILYDEEENVKF